ncbi:MAG: tetratricopeptide repeat protein [Acidobacteriota bacterium]
MKNLKKILINIFCLSLFIFILIFFTISPYLFSQAGLGKGRISGIVVDDTGNPIEGALIVAQSIEHQTKLDAKSEKDGSWAIGGLGSGIWRITATKNGYTSSFIEMNVHQLRQNPPITFTLKKLPGAIALQGDKEAFDMFDKGSKLQQEKRYDESLEVFQEFSFKFPEIYQVHLNVGSIYMEKGELEKACQEFQYVLNKIKETQGEYKKDEEAARRAFTGLGECALKKGDLDEAQKNFSKALEISPKDSILAYNVGEIFFSHSKVDEAIKYFDLATKIKKEWPKPYLKLGYCHLNKADFEKSIEFFKKFLELDPQNPEAQNIRSIIAQLEKMKK